MYEYETAPPARKRGGLLRKGAIVGVSALLVGGMFMIGNGVASADDKKPGSFITDCNDALFPGDNMLGNACKFENPNDPDGFTVHAGAEAGREIFFNVNPTPGEGICFTVSGTTQNFNFVLRNGTGECNPEKVQFIKR